MQRGAVGRTLESDRPAALNLKPVVRPPKVSIVWSNEMEMVCAGAGGNETVSFSLLAEPSRKQVPNNVSSQRSEWGGEISPSSTTPSPGPREGKCFIFLWLQHFLFFTASV